MLNIMRYTPLIAFILFMSTNTIASTTTNWSPTELQPLKQFFSNQASPKTTWPELQFINKAALPHPYNFLLTQPLMTLGISEYYQRTPKVRTPLYAINTPEQQTYSRAILMIVDQNKQRNDALLADKLGESKIVELGLITMNFAALPEAVKTSVLHSAVPFGALLVKNQLQTHDINTHYFNIICDETLAKHLHCKIGNTLYGRTNTLVRDDNGLWVAHVVEILTEVH